MPTRTLHFHKNITLCVLQNVLHFFVFDQRFKLGATGDGQIERLGREKGFQIEQVEVVVIHEIGEQLIGHSVQCGELRQAEEPAAIGRTIHVSGIKMQKTEQVKIWQALGLSERVNHALPVYLSI